MREPIRHHEPLSTEEIVRLFVQDGRSLREIGELAGVSRQTVSNMLKAVGVTTAQKGRRLAIRKAAHYEGEIKRLYVAEDRPIVEIARSLKLSAGTIAESLREQGVTIKRGGMRTIVFPELRKLAIGESLELPRMISESKLTYVRYYIMAKKAGIKVSVNVISDEKVRVRRVA